MCNVCFTMKATLGIVLTLSILRVNSDPNVHHHDLESAVNFLGAFTQESFKFDYDEGSVPQPYDVFKHPKRALQKLSSFINSNSSNVSQCTKHFLAFAKGLYQREPWALHMLDAYGKIGSGIRGGNVIWPGRFSLCNTIIQDERDPASVRGQYYLLVGIPNSENKSMAERQVMPPLRIGLCVPSSCTPSEFNKVMELINGISLIKQYGSAHVKCIPFSRNIWDDKKAVVCLAFCCLILVIICIGTIYDVYILFIRQSFNGVEQIISTSNGALALSVISINETKTPTVIQEMSNENVNTVSNISIVKEDPGVFARILLSFSIYTNATKLFSCTANANTLTCLNGIRVLSICWVILGHTYMDGASTSDNLKDVIEWLPTFSFTFVGQANFAVDTFFVLSGLLVTYLYLREHEKRNGKISWIKFYVHRYWRLTPVYAVTILIFQTILFPYYINGPFWPEADVNCEKNWWWNLLYINNFQKLGTLCMGHSWYLSNDMQFYVISPILLICLTRSLPVSAVISGVLILTNWIVSGVIATYYEISMSILEVGMNPNMFEKFYVKPYNRIAPYIIGMICGYFLFKGKCKTKINNIVLLIGWLTAAGVAYGVILGPYYSDVSRPIISLYLALSRSAWSVALTWMIFACCNGYGGFLNSFLSWPVWQPFARLTYSVYLIHMVIIRLFVLGGEISSHFSHLAMVVITLASVVGSFFAAIFLSLAFEAPLLALEKIIL